MSSSDVVATPTPLATGTFALYDTPEGGRIIAYRMEGSEDSERIVIPPIVMKIWEAQQRGVTMSPMSMIKMMSGKV